jgi:hypothetical protein
MYYIELQMQCQVSRTKKASPNHEQFDDAFILIDLLLTLFMILPHTP